MKRSFFIWAGAAMTVMGGLGPNPARAEGGWTRERMDSVIASVREAVGPGDGMAWTNLTAEQALERMKGIAVRLANRVAADGSALKREVVGWMDNLTGLSGRASAEVKHDPATGDVKAGYYLQVDKTVADEIGLPERWEVISVRGSLKRS